MTTRFFVMSRKICLGLLSQYKCIRINVCSKCMCSEYCVKLETEVALVYYCRRVFKMWLTYGSETIRFATSQ